MPRHQRKAECLSRCSPNISLLPAVHRTGACIAEKWGRMFTSKVGGTREGDLTFYRSEGSNPTWWRSKFLGAADTEDSKCHACDSLSPPHRCRSNHNVSLMMDAMPAGCQRWRATHAAAPQFEASHPPERRARTIASRDACCQQPPAAQQPWSAAHKPCQWLWALSDPSLERA